MTKKFADWVATSATPEQKEQFINAYKDILSTRAVNQDFTPNTEEKVAVWEAYCAATGQDATLPGNSAPVHRDETPSA